MTTLTPDLFTNVHKGIRNALFEVCIALGRAADDDAAPRARLREALRFVAHHGENEDLLLLPLVEARAPDVHARIEQAHADVNAALGALTATLDEGAPTSALYHRTCDFVALYLEHMREEEHDLDPLIRAALSGGELASFGRGSVERTAPDDQRVMLAWMLPAMTEVDVDAFLSRVPPGLATELRAVAGPRTLR